MVLSQAAEPLPTGFKTIAEIRELSNEQLKARVLVNVFGFVKDFMPPKETKGTGILYVSCSLGITTVTFANMRCRRQMHH